MDSEKDIPPAPCSNACPLGTDVQKYVEYIFRGDYERACEILSEVNPFPSVCGRVCTHPCEMECRRGGVDEPVAVRQLKRFAAEKETSKKKPTKKKHKEKIAVIGGGVCGLTCGSDLAVLGYPVTVFEAKPKVGGMLVYGIPAYRLPKEVVEGEVKAVRDLDVKYKTGHTIDSPQSLLEKGFTAVFVASGAWESIRLGIEGEGLEGVWDGLTFLEKINSGEKPEVGKSVAVVGGGDTAVDAARCALHGGAGKVTLVYRRGRDEMPARVDEVAEAEEEGVELMYLTSPKKIVGEGGRVRGLVCVKNKLGEPDESGRRKPLEVTGSEFEIGVDSVIVSIGQRPHVKIPKGAGIFSGGDAVSGPSTVVDAIASGKEGAKEIDAYLKKREVAEEKSEVLGELPSDQIGEIKPLARQSPQMIPPKKRKTCFTEIESPYTEKQALHEALRCLNCGAGAKVIKEKCAACLTCVRVCPHGAPKIEGDVAVVDPEKCLGCGLCAVECPALAIEIENNLSEGGINSMLKECKPKTILFRCRSGAILSDNINTPKNVFTVDVPCAGRVSVSNMLAAFENGAEEVVVAACKADDCLHDNSVELLKNRIEEARKILGEAGMDGESLRLTDISSDLNKEFNK